MLTSHKLRILHVEDTEEDVFLLQYAFKRAGIDNPVSVVSDGQQAVDYLSGHGRYADRKVYPLPCVVLLDLKLPLKLGLEVLTWIRQQPELDNLIVIVLTASANENDVTAAYRLRANAFLVKPADANAMAEMCRALKQFWLVFNRAAPVCIALGAAAPGEAPGASS